MRELGITVWVVTLALAVFAAPKDKKSDLLKLRNGKSLEVIVLDLGNDSVHYRLPSLQKKYTIARDEVARVEYGDGTIVSLDKKGGVSGATSVAWRELPITRDPKDVEGLISVEKIDVTLTTGSNMLRTKSADLEASAFLQLQQQAFEKGATIILIKSTQFKTAYGEPPAIHIVGESFRSVTKRNGKR